MLCYNRVDVSEGIVLIRKMPPKNVLFVSAGIFR